MNSTSDRNPSGRASCSSALPSTLMDVEHLFDGQTLFGWKPNSSANWTTFFVSSSRNAAPMKNRSR